MYSRRILVFMEAELEKTEETKLLLDILGVNTLIYQKYLVKMRKAFHAYEECLEQQEYTEENLR